MTSHERNRGAIGAVALLGSAAAASIGLAIHARHVAPYRPVVEHIDIGLPSDAVHWSAIRIGFVTDTHIGPAIRAPHVARALDLLLAAKPDLLLLGGDYICESPRFADEAAAVLGEAAAQTPLGAYAVLGNHDYSNGAGKIAALLELRGIRVLVNEATAIAAGSGELWIAGVDDAILGSPDVARTFGGIPEGVRPLALWHEPDWAEETAWRGAMLQLSGHSHGGQVRLPLLSHLAAPTGGRRFVRGLNFAAGMPIYTSRGVGVYRPPVRFRCPPEITLLTLR